VTVSTERDSDSKRPGGATNGAIWVLSIAVMAEPAEQQAPARTPAGHEVQSVVALLDSWPAQQCAIFVVEAAANARIGPCRPITNASRSATDRRFTASVYTAGEPVGTTRPYLGARLRTPLTESTTWMSPLRCAVYAKTRRGLTFLLDWRTLSAGAQTTFSRMIPLCERQFRPSI